jgi:hypothetical protein
MKKALFFLLPLLAGILVFESCKKEERNEAAITTAEDLSAAEDFSEQIDLDADAAIERGGGGSCPTVSFEFPEGTWPNTVTIDYGTGCTDPLTGRFISGKLIVQQTAPIRESGAVRTITHENFIVDEVRVEGTRTWTNNGLNADGNWAYTKDATDMKLTFEDGRSTTWSKTRTSTLIQGGNTAIRIDDVWSSTGTASGINRNGRNFTATITEPLIKKASCRWISSGVLDFSVESRNFSLDFGEDTCDRFGTLTVPNGNTYNIRLRR